MLNCSCLSGARSTPDGFRAAIRISLSFREILRKHLGQRGHELVFRFGLWICHLLLVEQQMQHLSGSKPFQKSEAKTKLGVALSIQLPLERKLPPVGM